LCVALVACGGETSSRNPTDNRPLDARADSETAEVMEAGVFEAGAFESGSASSDDGSPEAGLTDGGSLEDGSLDAGVDACGGQFDPSNCTACGVACAPGQICVAGACRASPPSCAPGGPGMTNCGDGHESCCTTLTVPGGTFYRTYDPIEYADPATVSTFLLDEYLVTFGRFRQFVTAANNGWLPQAGSGKHTYLNHGLGLVDVTGTQADGGLGYEPGWLPTADAVGNVSPAGGFDPYSGLPVVGMYPDGENLPASSVNWYMAYAFCIWDGGFLPSEAEWEYAAAGGKQERRYPWGSTEPGTANQYAIYGCLYPQGSGACADDPLLNNAPVGTARRGAGLWGQLDLAGDAAEWVLDVSLAYYVPCTDCGAFSTAPPGPVIRGGAMDGTLADLPAENRGEQDGHDPSERGIDFGFRCARAP